jgi:hypothetical protein
LRTISYRTLEQSDEESDFKALCSSYFDLAAIQEFSEHPLDRVLEYFKIITIGYLGEGWHLVKSFLKENEGEIRQLAESDQNWNARLMLRSFLALFYTVKKDSWEDLRLAVNEINTLREEQKLFEEEYLTSASDKEKLSAANELVSLYHFSKSVELLAQYAMNGLPGNIQSLVRFHLDNSNRFSEASGNFSLKLLIEYFPRFQ